MAGHMIFASEKRPLQIKTKALLLAESSAIIMTMASLFHYDYVMIGKRGNLGVPIGLFILKKENQGL